MRMKVISDVMLWQGIVASLLFPLFLYYLRQHQDDMSAYAITAIAWFSTWIFRQFTVNAILQYKEKHNIPVHDFYIHLPFLR